jgi:hypothetical protein
VIAERRFALDVALAVAGFTAILAAVVALVYGVELARMLGEGDLSLAEWGAQLAGRLPGRVIAALPIAGALGAARATAVWDRTGRLIAVTACGRSPVRLAASAVLAAGMVALVVAGLREVAAPWAASVVSGPGTWVVLDGPVPAAAEGARLHLRADTLVAGHAEDVVAAWVRDGELVGRGEVALARWDGATWAMEGAVGLVWPSDVAVLAVDVPLPPPDTWHRSAGAEGSEASLQRLWTAPDSPARTTWLLERLLTPLGTAVVAGLAVALLLAGRRLGTAWVLAAAVAWRLGQGGALAVCARGQWSVWAGAWAPLLALVLLTGLAWRWLDRRVA